MNILNSIANVFGQISSMPGAVIMMISIFIMGVFLARIKVLEAFKAALYVGTGIVGLNTMIGMFAGAVGPVLTGAIESADLKFTMIDMGTGSLTSIQYAFPLFPVFLIWVLVFNVILILLKITDTFDVDVNNWGLFILPAVMIYPLTNGSVIACLAAISITELIVLKLADFTAPKLAEHYGMEGISIPHVSSIVFAPIGLLVDTICERIPVLKKIDFSADVIQEKFNGMIDPSTLGFVIGIVIGVIAKLPIGKTLEFGITIAAFMLIFPKCVQFLVEGIMPIVEGMRDFAQKRLKRDVKIGLDAAILIGMPEVISAGLLLVPIILLLAVILPGNKFLPLADLAIAAPFLITMCSIYCRGNVFRGVLSGIIVFTIALYVCTYTAPVFTEAASYFGVPFSEGVVGNSLGMGSSPLYWAIHKIFSLFF